MLKLFINILSIWRYKVINIKPVSDLRNYNSVLEKVEEGNPVYLTKNGNGEYVIYDIKDQERFDKLEKAVKLMADLLEGRESGEKEGYVSIEDLRKKYK